MPNLTCSVDGCDRKRAARGWCATHYARCRKHGDVNITMNPHRAAPGVCIVEGCANEDHGTHGYCNKHAIRVRRYGDPSIEKRATGRKVCTIDGCSRLVEGKGLCPMHWSRNKRNGDPLIVRGVPAWEASPHWKGEDASYDAIHWRMRKIKGKASARACTDCGEEAQEWSYIGGAPDERVGPASGNMLAYSQDPNYYTARCVPCHRRHDLCK